MKKIITLVSAAALSLASATALAAPKDGKHEGARYIPVLVSVNVKGQVTEVKPAYKLRPGIVQAIQGVLGKMITKPAMNHGKPVPCQFEMTLAMTAVPTGHGKYSASFKYVSSRALPTGTWYWVRTQDNRLALGNQESNSTIDIGQIRSNQISQANYNNSATLNSNNNYLNPVGRGH